MQKIAWAWSRTTRWPSFPAACRLARLGLSSPISCSWHPASNALRGGSPLRAPAPLHVGRNRAEISIDPECFPADLLDQLAFIPNAHRKVLHQIDGIDLLPFIVALIGPPFDEARPAGQGRQMQ